MLQRLYSPSRILCLADLAAVSLSCLAGVLARLATGGSIDFADYAAVMPWLLIFPVLYLVLDLYPANFLRRPEEIKRLSIATSIGFMGLTLFSFLAKEGHTFSRMAMLIGWLLSIVSVPLARHTVRVRCAKCSWWRIPCVLFARGERLTLLCREVARAESQGIYPVAVVLAEGDPEPCPGHCADGLELVRVREENHGEARDVIGRVAARYPGAFALVALDDAAPETRRHWLNIIDLCFQKIVLIPDIFAGARVWVMAVTIGHLSGVLLKQNLLDARRMALKRVMDLALTIACGGFLLLALLVFSIAIRLDSRGPAIFRQQRIGRGGRRFMIYKFRTMALDAPERLQKYLADNPGARAEWEADQKLRDDPRVTRIGHLLRKTSLDELPQVINVLRGEMSLVGPRPIVDSEIPKYGDAFELYTRVRPGITGLWQISGRNNISYASRVWLDKHYVCNWSVWMDVLIMAQTIPVVLRGTGAY